MSHDVNRSPGPADRAEPPGWAERTVEGLLRRSAGPGRGTLVLEVGGRTRVSGSGDPQVRVTVLDGRTWSALLRKGSIGLAESYLAGWWDADDLVGLIRLALRRTEGLRRSLDWAGRHGGGLLDLSRRLRPPSKEDDRRRVAAHYDLSNELFAAMLDPTMAYSCAYFSSPTDSLEEAQGEKFDRLCRKLALRADEHVVEIGTGWGGFALHAAEHYGCRVTTTTISEAQRELAVKRVADRGLGDRVRVLGLDYRDLEGHYDALVSIEMIEAVDWRRHDDYFATCARLLAPHGRMGLQAITIADASYERAKHHGEFIRTLVFPGGCIPSVAAITASVARTGDLRIVDLEDIGDHYPPTLRRWRQNLDAHRGDLGAMGFDERFRRFFDLYLAYCEGAFLERHISDVQIVLARPHAPLGGSRR